MWHEAHTFDTPGSALCLACAPATLGNVVPDGGSPWQEAQFTTVNGDPAAWQTVQTGAVESGELPVTAWQTRQLASKPAWFTDVCEALRKGTEWLAPPAQEKASWVVPWQVNVPHVCPWAL